MAQTRIGPFSKGGGPLLSVFTDLSQGRNPVRTAVIIITITIIIITAASRGEPVISRDVERSSPNTNLSPTAQRSRDDAVVPENFTPPSEQRAEPPVSTEDSSLTD